MLYFLLTHTPKALFARQAKLQPPRPIEHHMSHRFKTNTIKNIVNLCKVENKQAADIVMDQIFYKSLEQPQHALEVLRWKKSVDFLFRQYHSVIMHMQNEQVFFKQEKLQMEKDHVIVKKFLIYTLYNHKALAFLVNKSDRNPQDCQSFLSFYVKSICKLILGDYEGEKELLLLLNTTLKQAIGNKEIYLAIEEKMEKSQQHRNVLKLMDTENPKYLNFKETILFNLLIYRMFRDSEVPLQRKNKPMALYNKIKQGKQIQLEDLFLTDYDEFLNIWVSAKFDAPIEWRDLEEVDKAQYRKYIYMLAENEYINKNKQKTKEILSHLEPIYPHRIFLEMSQLYDEKKFTELQQKYNWLQDQVDSNQIVYFKQPEYDIFLFNIIELIKKANYKQGPFTRDNLQGILKIFKHNYNIKEIHSQGMPFYYLNIPFTDYLLDKEFYDIIERPALKQ